MSLSNAIDVRDRFPGARVRPALDRVEAVVVHRLHLYDRPGSRWERAARFWAEDPEALATTTMAGSYSSKLRTIREWQRDGVPRDVLARAVCPYHLLIDESGWVYQALALHQRGAHTRGRNSTSIAVALLGDFRDADELEPWEQGQGRGRMRLGDPQARALREVLRDLLVAHPDAEILTHSEADPRTRKACPGARVVRRLPELIAWADLAADHVRRGDSRR